MDFTTKPTTGILIAIEGIDGAGKTTQVDFLEQALTRMKVAFTRSKEPTNGPWGQKIRQSAKTGRLPLAEEIEAFVEDRKEHLRGVVYPALEQGNIVVLDRYFFSTIAYQGSRGGDVAVIERQMRAFAPNPDAVILLDVPPDVGIGRISDGRGEEPNAFEDRSNLKGARAVFRDLAEHHANIHLIDATPPARDVSRKIFDILFDGILKEKFCAKSWDCDVLHCGFRHSGDCDWFEFRRRAYALLA